jgi:hypothetical protein
MVTNCGIQKAMWRFFLVLVWILDSRSNQNIAHRATSRVPLGAQRNNESQFFKAKTTAGHFVSCPKSTNLNFNSDPISLSAREPLAGERLVDLLEVERELFGDLYLRR